MARHKLSRQHERLRVLREEARSLLTRARGGGGREAALEARLRRAEGAQIAASEADDFEAAEAYESELAACREELASGQSEVGTVDTALQAAEAALLEGARTR